MATLAASTSALTASMSRCTLRSSTSATAPLRRTLRTSARLSQAEVPAPTMPAAQQAAKTTAPRSVVELVQRYPAHPLLRFFRMEPRSVTVRADASSKDAVDGKVKKDVLVPTSFSPLDVSRARANAGRSWTPQELRLKSSHELHVLWYVLLHERNRLATSWDEVIRVGARNLARRSGETLSRRNHRVRKSMARIKHVLNERRLALIQAQIAARQPRPAVDEVAEVGAEEEAEEEVVVVAAAAPAATMEK